MVFPADRDLEASGFVGAALIKTFPCSKRKPKATNRLSLRNRTAMSLQQWVQVASVFLAAFLAMCTGIGLELFRNWRASLKDRKEKQRREVAQLKVAIAGIAFNIEIDAARSVSKPPAASRTELCC